MEAPERRLLQVCAYLDCDRLLGRSRRRSAGSLPSLPSRAGLLLGAPPAALLLLCNDLLKRSASSCLAANRVAFWKLVSRVALSQPLLLLAALPSQSSQALPSALLAAWIAACKRSAKCWGFETARIRAAGFRLCSSC
uniref:F-box domain-containing protein n=1 Tax=Macrostomum lignano TaxID=282301 RepID=A0A1I8FHX4_9PLAT